MKKFYELKKINLIIENDYYKENANVNILKVVQKIISIEPEVGSKAMP